MSHRINTMTYLTLKFLGPVYVKMLDEGGYELSMGLSLQELKGLEAEVKQARIDTEKHLRGGA